MQELDARGRCRGALGLCRNLRSVEVVVGWYVGWALVGVHSLPDSDLGDVGAGAMENPSS